MEETVLTNCSTHILDYPFEASEIMRKAKKLRKELLAQDGLIDKRIAILGGSSTQHVASYLELFLLRKGIRPTIYQSDYARFWEDAVFGNSELVEFSPDVVIVHTSVRNLGVFGSRDDNYDQERGLQSDRERFIQAWDALAERFSCPIIQNNFERPPYRLLGNQDIADVRGMANYVFRMNTCLYKYAQTHSTFLVHDIEGLAADYGLLRWHDSDSWCLYRYAFAIEAMPLYAHSLAAVVGAVFGRSKRALITDLDNTLWKGVAGDDGIDAIAMGPDTPEGEKHRMLQAYLRQLRGTGVLLAVNSKNDVDVALGALEHPDSLLAPDDFAAIEANWQAKSANIERLSERLSLGSDSFVFLDDNPAERMEVVQAHPEVSAVPFDDIGIAPALIDRSGLFERTVLTEDDLRRAEQYRQNAQREQHKETFTSYEDYLESLEMKACNVGFDEVHLSRIAQLTNKTNQFNLTTQRCTEDEIQALANDPKNVCLALTLSDRFGDNGLVSVVAAKAEGRTLDIVLWLMSCRVLKRGLENLAFNLLIEAARKRGVKTITGTYIPTNRNGMVRDHYRDLGFELKSKNPDGKSTWMLDCGNVRLRETHVELLDLTYHLIS